MLATMRAAQVSLPSLLQRWGAAFSSTTSLRGLQDIIPVMPKEGEEAKAVAAGRAWKASDLRLRSWDDLHKLWYVLLKERNLLHAEKLMFKARGKAMLNPNRITKVRKSMNRVKQVLGERLGEHSDPTTRLQLKAVIDAM